MKLQWLLAPMTFGCCAIAVLDQSWITLASSGEKILDHGISQQGVVLQSPVSEAGASVFKEEVVRQCVSCLISHVCLIPRHVFSFDFFLFLFEIV
jgi:hypothetical protein